MSYRRRHLSFPLTTTAAWLAAIAVAPTLAQEPFTNDESLFNFVTRPEIRAPKLDVRVYDQDAVTPGYYFVAPYSTDNNWEDHDGPLFETCQVGPIIYDSNGDLIWSGACQFNNLNAFDFRPADYGGKKYLSLNVARGAPSQYGAGVILSDTFEVVHEVEMSGHTDGFNQHEFSVVDDGASVLFVGESARQVSAASINLGDEAITWARSNQIREVSLEWGQEGSTLFEWDCIDHVPLNESTFPWPKAPDEGRGWDYMHMNSIDKFPNGDYLVSMRYSNSLFRISGGSSAINSVINDNSSDEESSSSDSSIVWRLGGARSDFRMRDGFAFSRQHHARILTTNATHTLLSLLDNAAGSLGPDDAVTAPESSALVLLLAHDPADASRASWEAEVVRRFARPDGDYSHLRGSVQILPPLPRSDDDDDEEDPTRTPFPSSVTSVADRYPAWERSNVFVGWSANAYMTEFTPDGAVAAEARFVGNRFDTYRAYKFAGFVGRPTEPPAVKAFVFGDILGSAAASGSGSGSGGGGADDAGHKNVVGTGEGKMMTVAYVSWNGATEVAAWRVYGRVVHKEELATSYQANPASSDSSSSSDSHAFGAAASPAASSAASTSASPSPSSSSFSSAAGAAVADYSYPSSPHSETTHKEKRAAAAAAAGSNPQNEVHLGTFPRTGFETLITLAAQPIAHLRVQALDARGRVIGQSARVAPVIPAQQPFNPAPHSTAAFTFDESSDGDEAFDAGEGVIGFAKISDADTGPWGYAALRDGAPYSGMGLAGILALGAGVGVVAAAAVLAVWWCVAWRAARRRERRRARKGKGRFYSRVRGGEESDGDDEEGFGLSSGEEEDDEDDSSEDSYVGQMAWAPTFGPAGTAASAAPAAVFGRGTAGVGGALVRGVGRGGVDEREVERRLMGAAPGGRQQGRGEGSSSSSSCAAGASSAGPVGRPSLDEWPRAGPAVARGAGQQQQQQQQRMPLILQARNRWD